jgi:hypothetical protein
MRKLRAFNGNNCGQTSAPWPICNESIGSETLPPIETRPRYRSYNGRFIGPEVTGLESTASYAVHVQQRADPRAHDTPVLSRRVDSQRSSPWSYIRNSARKKSGQRGLLSANQQQERRCKSRLVASVQIKTRDKTCLGEITMNK